MVIELLTLKMKYLPFRFVRFLRRKLCYFPGPSVKYCGPSHREDAWILDQQCHRLPYFYHPLPAFCLEARTADLAGAV